MKALIIQKKWCDKIFDEGKIWEWRGVRTNIRGTIAIIQSKGSPEKDEKNGKVIGTVEVVDCLGTFTLKELEAHIKKHKVPKDLIYAWGGYKNNFVYVLKNAKRFKKPKDYVHPSGAVTWVDGIEI